MRGFPFLNLLIALAMSGGVFFPLVWRQTHITAAPVAAAGPETADAEETLSAHVSLRFVHTPGRVRLANGDRALQEWKAPESLLLEETVALPRSGDRISFELQIEWPAGTPEANNVVVQIEPRGFQKWKDVFFSSSGAVDEIIEFDLRP